MKNLVFFILLLFPFVSFTQVTFSGKIFYDNNANQIFDNGQDSASSIGIVLIENLVSGAKLSTIADTQGNYTFLTGIGSYKISLYNNYNSFDYLVAEPVSGDYLNPGPVIVNFALQPQPDLPVKITGQAYYDNNQNDMFDAGDSAVVNGLVNVNIPNTYFFETAYTNSSGRYNIRRPFGIYHINLFELTYNTEDYDKVALVYRDYKWPVIDTINFPVHKKDSVLYLNTNLSTNDYGSIPAAGATLNHNISTYYDGALPSMQAILSLDFNPLLNITSSLAPTIATPGHLQWYVDSIKVQTEHLIDLAITFPAVGDTIDAFGLHYEFKPAYIISNVPPVIEDVSKQIAHTSLSTSNGPTRGLKWLRTFTGIPYDTEDRSYSIDTAQTGDFYYTVGYLRSVKPYGGLMIAKLDKDGLSVWEKYPGQLIAGVKIYDGAIVKHTKDGGCVVIGHAYDSTAEERQSDVLVMKFDTEGNMLWHKMLGGTKDDGNWYENDLLELTDGFLITGTTRSRDGDFASNHMDTLNKNVFVAKLGSNGSLLWQKQYGGSRHDIAFKMLTLKNGTYLILGATQSLNGDVIGAHNHLLDYASDGYYTNQGSYVHQPDSAFAEEAWVMNIDANGNQIWNRCYGGTNVSYILGAIETNSGLLLNGITNSKDGDLANYEEQMIPFWLLNVSPTGNINWQKTHKLFKGYKDEAFLESYNDGGGYPNRIHKTKDGNFVTAISVRDKYGDIKSKHGGTDIVLVKINEAGNILWQKAIGGNSKDEVYDVQLDKYDNILFAGNTSSENDDMYEPLNNSNYMMVIGKAGITNTISGKVFIDKNANYLQDAGEPLFNEGRISSYKKNDTTIARIFNGRYLNNVDTGTYITRYSSSNDYYTVFPAQQNTLFNSFDQEAVIDFGLVPKPGIKDLQLSITTTSPARPGFDVGFRIITKNVGTESIAGAFIKLKKPSTLTYLNATRATGLITADTITFVPLNMTAGFVDTLDINLKLGVPPAINNGDTLSFTAIAFPQATDTTPNNNLATLREIVGGSFDPNDKTEAHTGIYTPTMKASGEPFQYLVRFQNTGTDTAFYVTVKDTLDSKVDIYSLETISSSHPYKLSVDGNIATWQFDRIKLVDSTTNEPASHGYISFTVQPKNALKIGDTTRNKAAIYFDFNLPVITNENLLAFISDNSVICAGGSTQLPAGQPGIAYQWQINTGNGFTNLAASSNYSGVNANTLLLTNMPSSTYGTQYRCIITLAGGGKINGDTYKITFANTWTGTTSTAWEIASNWSCGTVPDVNTDVVIKSTAIRQPEVTTITAICHSINATNASHVWIKAGAKLEVKGSN
ncbi:MAG: hypothetical protein V4717_24020 [Bacteroidota bacterium]